MAYIIRRAALTDVAAVAPLFNMYRVFYKQASDEGAALDFLRERLTYNQSVILLAYDDNDCAVGFAQLYPIFSSVSMSRAWLLNDLFVKEANRGTGAGSLLLTAVKIHAIQTQSKWIMLQTEKQNTAAQKLYDAQGYVQMNDLFYILNIL